MNKFSRDLVQGMQEAAAFVEGKKVGAREHVSRCPTCAPSASGFICRSSASPRPTAFRYRR